MEFYGSIEAYKAYHLTRNNDIPVSDDEDISAALLVASEWLDGRYRTAFGGLKTAGRDQVREWPRQGVVDIYKYAIASNSVPREIENATYEATWRHLVTPGALTVDYTPGKYKSVSVDGAVSVEFAGFNSVAELQSQFAIIDMILAPLLTGDNGVGQFASFSGNAVRT